MEIHQYSIGRDQVRRSAAEPSNNFWWHQQVFLRGFFGVFFLMKDEHSGKEYETFLGVGI